MSKTVHVAFDGGDTAGLRLQWPNRCVACESRDGLRASTARVGRLTSMRPNLLGGLTIKSDILHLQFPMCARHARDNALASLILDGGPLARYLRFLAYSGLPVALTMLLGIAVRRGLPHDVPGFFTAFGLFGAAGVAAVVWARRAIGLWVKRLDPDDDLLTLRFANDAYAGAFERANPVATDPQVAVARPWFRRPALFKLLLIVGLFLWVLWLQKRH